MYEMTLLLLPDRWVPMDPRQPELELGWAISDLTDLLHWGNWSADELRALGDSNEPDSADAEHALEVLYGQPPSKMAQALRDAASKIESLTIRPVSERRN